MAPRLVTGRNRYKLNHTHKVIFTKQLDQMLRINTRLRKRVAQLSTQNKELSSTRNNLLLQKLTLENEINSVKNSNVTLSSLCHTTSKKVTELEQTLQKCVPALVTLSKCIPSMMETVHGLCKVEKINQFNYKDKKEKQTRSVKPMVNGMTIDQPAVSVLRLNMSPIIESPNSEQTPIQQERSSFNSPNANLNSVPYVRLKDVAVMLKNSKTVQNENHSALPSVDNLGEGPSWLYTQENQIQNVDVAENTSLVFNNSSTSISRDMVTSSNVHASTSSSVSSFSGNSNNSINENEINNSEYFCETSVLRNITSRKRSKRRSSETSVASDIDNSFSSQRPKRSIIAKVNYREPSLIGKLRRNK